MKNIKPRYYFFIIAATFIICTAATNPAQRYFEIAKNLDIFASVFSEVNTFYVDEIEPDELVKTGIDAMLRSLDPYTTYIPEDEVDDFRTQSTGEYGGIGAITSKIQGRTKVVMLYKGFAAHKNGVIIGDEIIKVNNVDITQMSREAINRLMKGQANSRIHLTLQRYGMEKPIDIDLEREKVTISCVPYFGMVSEKTGYIKLTEFTMNASKEVKKAVLELKQSGAERMILDVRNNPGGLLSEAVNVTNIFLAKGMETVSTKGKIIENNNVYKTLNDPVDTEIPLAVLTNGGSASASEIVAGVIQDYDRGIIIGQKSYGKGLVQISRPLNYNAQLKVTTAKYHTPSGRCIQALDYRHKDRQGKGTQVPDSLKQAFKTTNGRTVYDGGGIDPDIEITNTSLAPFALSLFRKGFIFDYATKYYYEHGSIIDAQKFSINDKEYQEFSNWISEKGYTYSSEAEEHLASLKAISEKENYYGRVATNITALEKEIEKNKAHALTRFKKDIRYLLDREISARYYLEKGMIENTFHRDRELHEAINVLSNPKAYKELLN